MAPIATLTVRLSAQIAEFQQQFAAATRSTQQFQQGFQQTATKAAAIGSFLGISAAAGVAKLTAEISNFVAQGQKLSGVERSFERLAISVRQNGDEMRGALREGTRGLVSDLDLMQSANKAILLGLPVTSKEMGELAKTATVLGKAMGQDATKSLDDLITALGRSSPLILDNLGLTVKVGEANEAYARKLGISVTAMSEAEKKMAFYTAAMEAARAKTNELGEETLTLVEMSQVAWTSVGNVVTRAAATMNNQIGKILTRKDDLITFLQLVAASGSPGQALQFLQTADEARARTGPKPDINLPDPNAKSAGQIKALSDQMDKARKATDAYRDSVRNLADELSGANLRGEVKRLQDAWKSLSQTEKASQDVMERTADIAIRLHEEGAVLTGELFALTVQTGRFQSTLPPVVSGMAGLENEFQDITPAIQKSADQLIEFIALLNSLKPKPGLEGLNLNDFAASVDAAIIPDPPPDRVNAWIDAFGEMAAAAADVGIRFDSSIGRALAFGGGLTQSLAAMASGFKNASDSSLSFGQRLAGATTIIGAYLQAMALVEDINRRDPWQMNSFDRFLEEIGGLRGLDDSFKRLGELGAEFKQRFREILNGGVWRTSDMDALLEEFKTALDEFDNGLERAIEGVNRRAAAFASPFQKILDEIGKADTEEAETALKNKLAAMAEAGQEGFERLGSFVAATFAAIVKDSGDAIGAIQSLAPAFQTLQDGVEKFGLTSTGAIDSLLSSFKLINDATLGPIFEAIQATGQIFVGLQGAGYGTAELFQTVAADIGASFRELEAKGGDVAKALALSQPILQKLWEAQKKYGAVTDETTAALLHQAEQQGIVGAHMKDVNEKILDVLIAIADVFGAVIPASLRATADAASDTAASISSDFAGVAGDIEDSLSRIRVPKITIPVDYDLANLPERELRPFNLSSGGDDFGSLSASVVSGPDSQTSTVIIDIDGERVATAVVPYIPGEVQRYGLA